MYFHKGDFRKSCTFRQKNVTESFAWSLLSASKANTTIFLMVNNSISFWNDPKKRAWIFQSLLLVLVLGVISFLVYNTQTNLKEQGTASGFGFLSQEAGFEISESSIEYWADDTYLRALTVGVINTFKVAIIGNFFAILLGVFVGICRLSEHWLISKISQCYVEVVRNIPLLLQLFFWYAVFIEVFPSVRQAYEPLPNVYLSQRGMVFPVFKEHPVWLWVKIMTFFGVVASLLMRSYLNKQKERKGKTQKGYPFYLFFLLGIPLLTWFLGGAPAEIDWPELGGFNFNGGMTISPEFSALIIGLVVYTSAFNAEIVRAGIESVSKGQWEASRALGLTNSQALRLVILPQSLRVIIPPITSQILNLIKNSSLAVGIGYPDFVSVANTTMNQTGQAIEAVVMIMVVYLFFSLSTSLFMNLYNRKTKLIQRGSAA